VRLMSGVVNKEDCIISMEGQTSHRDDNSGDIRAHDNSGGKWRKCISIWRMYKPRLVHPKMKIKSLITHPHAVPTP